MSRRAWLLALVVVRFVAPSVAFSTPAGGRPVTHDPAPTAVVASFREILGEVAGEDRGPTIDVYGDGRIAVHRPHYMVRAGEWTARLRPQELQALLATLVDDGVLDFDGPASRGRLARARADRRAAARRGEALVYEVSDPSVVEITLRANGRERTIVWTGLRGDAWVHPEMPELQGLRRAHDTLRALADRPGLRRAP